MYLMPNPERKVLLRDPRTMVALPSYGGNCSNTSYWVRRQKDGDAIPTTKEKVAAGAAKAEEESKAKAKAYDDAKAAMDKSKADEEAKADTLAKADGDDESEPKPAGARAKRSSRTTGSRS